MQIFRRNVILRSISQKKNAAEIEDGFFEMNINEIAKLANVSRATVSRYFNDGYVSAEKREQIRRVIEETGYKPSAQAQMLRTKKTKQIGVILSLIPI